MKKEKKRTRTLRGRKKETKERKKKEIISDFILWSTENDRISNCLLALLFDVCDSYGIKRLTHYEFDSHWVPRTSDIREEERMTEKKEKKTNEKMTKKKEKKRKKSTEIKKKNKRIKKERKKERKFNQVNKYYKIWFGNFVWFSLGASFRHTPCGS